MPSPPTTASRSGSALQSAIDIRKAFNLNSLDKADEAQGAAWKRSRKKSPKDIRPLEALGNIMRARKKYAEAVSYFTRAIALIAKPDQRHWSYYYARGTSYERMKNWPAAEADLKRALAARARPAAGAQLSRLFLDRPGPQHERGHEADREGRVS